VPTSQHLPLLLPATFTQASHTRSLRSATRVLRGVCCAPRPEPRARPDSILSMSRAFVKDPETPGPTCPSPPGCGGSGVPVSSVTLRARLRPEAAARFGEEAFFCPDPACEVAYFDGRLAWAARSELLEPAYPKQAGAPLCACFGIAREAIEELGRRGDKAAMRAFLERAASPEARCATRAADGRSCATEARRVFLRALPGAAEE